MESNNFRRTGDECPICEEGELLKGDYEKMCDSCYTVIEPSAFVKDVGDGWENWWKHREEKYSGFYGTERIKMVGGFEYPYY